MLSERFLFVPVVVQVVWQLELLLLSHLFNFLELFLEFIVIFGCTAQLTLLTNSGDSHQN